MKRNDSGDFSVLYIEAGDERATLFPLFAAQKKPVVIMLAEQSRVFQRPDDFTTLKHIRRQLDLPVIFVIPRSGHLAQLAARNGFPVYLSMDALADALSSGLLQRQRTQGRATAPLANSVQTDETAHVATDIGQGTPKEGIARVAINHNQTTPLPNTRRISADLSQVTPYNGMYRIPTDALKPSPKKTIPLFLPEEPLPFPKSVPFVPPPPSMATPLPPSLPLTLRPQRRFPLLLVIMTVAVVAASLGFFLVQSHTLTNKVVVPPTIIGHISFASSEQVNETSSQGIEDEVVINLNNVPEPAAGTQYYAWLLGDVSQGDPMSVALGALPITNGHAYLFYKGDAQHTNLLQITSRFLVTEEDSSVPPIAPSPDLSNWRYYGAYSTTPINSSDNPKHFSYLDHLRHLLAADPTLNELTLPGGLNNWFYINTSKLLEWVSSQRDTWEQTKDTAFVRRQTTRVLEYLDGTSFTYMDLPPNSPLLVSERFASIGLLQVDGPDQEPPDYIDHIAVHLNGLLQSSSVTPAVRNNIAAITAAMSNVQYWLTQLHHDAQQIVKMSDGQLKQPSTLTLLNDMIANANYAYAGEFDPNTNTMREGVTWIHGQMQTLATLDISRYNAISGGSSNQEISGVGQPRAFVPSGVKK